MSVSINRESSKPYGWLEVHFGWPPELMWYGGIVILVGVGILALWSWGTSFAMLMNGYSGIGPFLLSAGGATLIPLFTLMVSAIVNGKLVYTILAREFEKHQVTRGAVSWLENTAPVVFGVGVIFATVLDMWSNIGGYILAFGSFKLDTSSHAFHAVFGVFMALASIFGLIVMLPFGVALMRAAKEALNVPSSSAPSPSRVTPPSPQVGIRIGQTRPVASAKPVAPKQPVVFKNGAADFSNGDPNFVAPPPKKDTRPVNSSTDGPTTARGEFTSEKGSDEL